MTDLALDNPVEVIDDVLTRQWLYDGKLVVFTYTTSYFSRRIVDTIADTVIDTMGSWSPDYPYLSLNIFTKGSLMTTPYSRLRIEEITQAFPNLRGRTATVTRPSPNAQVTQEWLDMLSHSQQRNLPHRIFFDRQEAVDWLTELL